MWKEFVKNILFGLISNTIFQVILLVASSSGFLYTIPKMIKSFKNREISISVGTLLILIFSCIFITAAIILLTNNYYNKIRYKNKIENVPDYYFTNYEKYVTIYNNGNGIIIHRFTVVANDVTKLNIIRRKLNIEDGNKFSSFPEFEKMLKTKKSERFNDYGFWYYSKDGIISEIKEYYWENGTSKEKENKKLKANTKEIRWIFKMNKNNINKGTPYEIAYVISVPGLAALENGKLNRDLLLDINEIEASSNMSIDHKIQKLKYTISFEDGISLQTLPECRYIVKGQDESKEDIVDGEHVYDLLYNKYIFKINNPTFGSNISISWKYDDI